MFSNDENMNGEWDNACGMQGGAGDTCGA